MAKKIDYKTTETSELLTIANDKRNELRTLRFNVAGSKNRDVKQAMKLRKDIARALTALSLPGRQAGAKK